MDLSATNQQGEEEETMRHNYNRQGINAYSRCAEVQNGRVHKEHLKDKDVWIEPGECLLREAVKLTLDEKKAEGRV